MDIAAKERVRDAMIAHAEGQLAELADARDTERNAAELDPETSYDVDDLSQSTRAGDMHGLVEESVAKQRRKLDELSALDLTPTQRVRVGAVVAFGGQRYLVGTVSEPVECDGESYEGIAADAPIIAALDGLAAGDSFSFNGHDHRIELVA